MEHSERKLPAPRRWVAEDGEVQCKQPRTKSRGRYGTTIWRSSGEVLHIGVALGGVDMERSNSVRKATVASVESVGCRPGTAAWCAPAGGA